MSAAAAHRDTPHAGSLRYRPDIDGLRALAVLCVIAYHAFPGRLRGGFIGVDIFFVISGFLISLIILEKLEAGAFSFIEFYSRRIRRIFPALCVVLAASAALGWFLLWGEEYAQLGKHIAGGALFVSNFVLWTESGYFDAAADTKPLVHLWSLGIEEQFYIVWPLLLWAAFRFRFGAGPLIGAAALASFALNVYTVQNDVVAAFYSPWTRAWELLAGATLALTAMRGGQSRFMQRIVPVLSSWRHAWGWLGVTAIACGLIFITDERKFPGWWALLPVVGAACIIAAGPQAQSNRLLFAARPMVWIGLISYPLYLWHWVLLCFLRIDEAGAPSAGLRIAAIVLSFVLAWLTYALIEKPLRFGKHLRLKTVALTLAMAAIAAAAYACFKQGGWEWRWGARGEYLSYFKNGLPEQPYFRRIGLGVNYRNVCDFYDLEKYRAGRATNVPRPSLAAECYTRDPAFKHAVFIWGDSHGAQYYSGLKNRLPADWQILQVTTSGCHPRIAEKDAPQHRCIHTNWFALQTIKQTRPDVVMVAQHATHDLATMRILEKRLKAMGVPRIVFAGPTPNWRIDLPRIIAMELWTDTPERTHFGIDEAVFDHNRRIKAQFASSESTRYADIIGAMCDDKGCLTRIGPDKLTGITSWDYGHLTPVASDYVAEKLLVELIAGKRDAAPQQLPQ